MKRFALAIAAAIAVNIGLFIALGKLNEKQPKTRELPPVAHIHYTPIETLAPPVPELAESAAEPPPPVVEPVPMPAAMPPPPTPIAESAIEAEPDLPVQEPIAELAPQMPEPLAPMPLDVPGLELPDLASTPELMTPRPPPPEPVAESPMPPPLAEPPPPEPTTDIVFTPDGFTAVENIVANLPSAPAYIEPDEQSFGPPPPSPASSGPNRAPQPLENPYPVYPSAARRRGIEGQVTIRIHIDPSGAVSEVEVVDVVGHDSFRSSVEKAVSRWRFTPALENGVPVAAWGERTIIFNLD
jgi:protein TonB